MASPMTVDHQNDKWMAINKHEVDDNGSDYLDLRSFMDVSDCPNGKRDARASRARSSNEANLPNMVWHRDHLPPALQVSAATAVHHSFVGIQLGDEFSTHEELLTKIQRVQEKTNVQLNRDQSTSLDKAHRKIPLRAIKTNPELKFTSIIYTCKFGGKKHIAAGSGKRQRKTLKRGCPARIRFGLADDCQKLVVKDLVDEHNHEVDKTIYDHLPRQRKLTEDDQKVIQRPCNKKMQLHSLETSGKQITLRDLSNIDVSAEEEAAPQDEVPKVVRLLQNVTGSVVRVFEDNGTFRGIFFQDHMMRRVFAAYPELLLFDATYKLTKLGMALYILLTVDGNGVSEIIGIYLAATDSETSLRNMTETFKKHNDSWSRTKVIMTDKDVGKRNVLKGEFPGAALQLCLFHTLRLFKMEFTKKAMNISSDVRDAVLSLLSHMAHSSTEADFNGHYHSFLELRVQKVTEFFNENWLLIKEEWVTAYKNRHTNLGVRTNNRLESVKGKIESACSPHASLDSFFTEFFAVLRVLRSERDHNSVIASLKLPSKREAGLTHDDGDERYRRLLTPYAFQAVERQMKLHGQVDVPKDGYCLSSSCGAVRVTLSSCQCAFYITMRLPCCHIFAIRRRDGVCTFSVALPAKRWRADLFASISEAKSVARMTCSGVSSFIDGTAAETKSAAEKYREAIKMTTKLANLATTGGTAKFEERMAFLRSVQQCWEDGDTPLLAINSVSSNDYGAVADVANDVKGLMMETGSPSDGIA